jgi:hypothetical protein
MTSIDYDPPFIDYSGAGIERPVFLAREEDGIHISLVTIALALEPFVY